MLLVLQGQTEAAPAAGLASPLDELKRLLDRCAQVNAALDKTDQAAASSSLQAGGQGTAPDSAQTAHEGLDATLAGLLQPQGAQALGGPEASSSPKRPRSPGRPSTAPQGLRTSVPGQKAGKGAGREGRSRAVRASMPVLGSLENLRDESPVRSWLPPNSARSRRSHDKAWNRKHKAGAQDNRPPFRSALPAMTGLFDVDRVKPESAVEVLLNRVKELEDAWMADKALYRRDAQEQRRRCHALELEHEKLQRAYQHRGGEMKGLKAALRSRDQQLQIVERKLRQLRDVANHDTQEVAEQFGKLKSERNELSALLDEAVKRMEALEAAGRQRGEDTALMQGQVSTLEEERARAAQEAQAAQQRAAELQEGKRRFEWQSALLQRLMEVQLKHNKTKTQSLRRMLESDLVPIEEVIASIGVSSSSDSEDSSEGDAEASSQEGDVQRQMPPSLQHGGGGARRSRQKHKTRATEHDTSS
eukprot:jgi/Astpho2/2410/Aster-x1073